MAYQDPASQNPANSYNPNHSVGGVNGESTTDASAKTGVAGSDHLLISLFLMTLAASASFAIGMVVFILRRKNK